MKKSLLTIAAIALVFSFTSCKQNPAETTEESAVEVIEAPAEVIETPVEEPVDTTSGEGAEVKENISETPAQ